MICNPHIRPRREWSGASVERWLSLAAAPTFAIMALMAFGGASEILCSAGASPLGGMIPMYLLMSAFHSAPWLRLIVRASRSPIKEDNT
jgi:hypothetical protein